MNTDEIAVSRRCDEAMRRSKEKGFRAPGIRWRCDGECKECICCIVKSDDGNERHFVAFKRGWWHT